MTDGVSTGCSDPIGVYGARTHKLLYALARRQGRSTSREGHVGCVTCLKLCGGGSFRGPAGAGPGTSRTGARYLVGEHGAIVTALAVAGATLCSAGADGFVGLWTSRRSRPPASSRPSRRSTRSPSSGRSFAARGDGETMRRVGVSAASARCAAVRRREPARGRQETLPGTRRRLNQRLGRVAATPLPAAALF